MMMSTTMCIMNTLPLIINIKEFMKTNDTRVSFNGEDGTIIILTIYSIHELYIFMISLEYEITRDNQMMIVSETKKCRSPETRLHQRFNRQTRFIYICIFTQWSTLIHNLCYLTTNQISCFIPITPNLTTMI